MSLTSVLEAVNATIICLQIAVLTASVWRKAYREHPFFVAFLAACLLQQCLCFIILFHRDVTGLTVHRAYFLYFCASWIGQSIRSALIVLTIYQIYSVLMQPLRSLQRLGRVVFRWVTSISIVLAVMVVLAPHASGITFFASLIGQVQQGVGILTLCLLLFVCFATHPLGLTFRSRVFGITLGLGIGAMTDLVQAAWLTTSSARSLYSPIFLVSSIGVIAGMLVWVTYYLRPEPARKMILLPTTSPFFFWNRIAEALGDAPGEVAVGGITPEMFAPAELLAFTSLPKREPAPIIEMPQIPQVAQR